MSKEIRACIIVPAYKEGSVIRSVIADSLKAIRNDGKKYDIVVINDGSPDNTASEAEKGGAIVINHILNSGAGGATATGLAYAKKHSYDYVATMDADGQHLINDVLKGLKVAQKTEKDLLIGSRLIDSTGMSKVKVLGNKGLSIITGILFRVNVTDSQSGLRIFSKKAINDLRWKSNGYEFCSEMLWRAKQLNLEIDEYPITAVYTDYSKSKGQNNWNAINIVKSLIRDRILEMFE